MSVIFLNSTRANKNLTLGYGAVLPECLRLFLSLRPLLPDNAKIPPKLFFPYVIINMLTMSRTKQQNKQHLLKQTQKFSLNVKKIEHLNKKAVKVV